MPLEEEDQEFEEQHDERTKFIPAQESNRTKPIITVVMPEVERDRTKGVRTRTRTDIVETEGPYPSESVPVPDENQNDNNRSCENNNKRDRDQSQGQDYQGRRKSTQSLVGSAHVQLQLFVEDVKGEIKEFTKPTKKSPQGEGGCDAEKCDGGEKITNESNSKSEKKVRTGWQRYLGIILAVASSMIFALCILIVKSLPQYHPYSVTFWRFQGVLLPTIPIGIYYRVWKKQKIFDSVWPPCRKDHTKTVFILFLRGITGAGAVTLQFYSLQYISMADSSVISFSTPVFVSLASHWILGEKSGFIPVLCGVITLLGVAVITRPPMLTGGEEFDTDTLIGAGLALGCMFLAASTFLILRYLRQIHFAVITIYFGLWGSFQTLALSASIGRFDPPQGVEHWMMALALAGLTFVGQTFITLAFKFEQAGTVSLCRTFDILFAYVWQYIFLGVVPDLYSMIGGLIVVFGVLIAAFRKFLTELPPDNKTRQKLWIMLK